MSRNQFLAVDPFLPWQGEQEDRDREPYSIYSPYSFRRSSSELGTNTSLGTTVDLQQTFSFTPQLLLNRGQRTSSFSRQNSENLPQQQRLQLPGSAASASRLDAEPAPPLAISMEEVGRRLRQSRIALRASTHEGLCRAVPSARGVAAEGLSSSLESAFDIQVVEPPPGAAAVVASRLRPHQGRSAPPSRSASPRPSALLSPGERTQAVRRSPSTSRAGSPCRDLGRRQFSAKSLAARPSSAIAADDVHASSNDASGQQRSLTGDLQDLRVRKSRIRCKTFTPGQFGVTDHEAPAVAATGETELSYAGVQAHPRSSARANTVAGHGRHNVVAAAGGAAGDSLLQRSLDSARAPFAFKPDRFVSASPLRDADEAPDCLDRRVEGARVAHSKEPSPKIFVNDAPALPPRRSHVARSWSGGLTQIATDLMRSRSPSMEASSSKVSPAGSHGGRRITRASTTCFFDVRRMRTDLPPRPSGRQQDDAGSDSGFSAMTEVTITPRKLDAGSANTATRAPLSRSSVSPCSDEKEKGVGRKVGRGTVESLVSGAQSLPSFRSSISSPWRFSLGRATPDMAAGPPEPISAGNSRSTRVSCGARRSSLDQRLSTVSSELRNSCGSKASLRSTGVSDVTCMFAMQKALADKHAEMPHSGEQEQVDGCYYVGLMAMQGAFLADPMQTWCAADAPFRWLGKLLQLLGVVCLWLPVANDEASFARARRKHFLALAYIAVWHIVVWAFLAAHAWQCIAVEHWNSSGSDSTDPFRPSSYWATVRGVLLLAAAFARLGCFQFFTAGCFADIARYAARSMFIRSWCSSGQRVALVLLAPLGALAGVAVMADGIPGAAGFAVAALIPLAVQYYVFIASLQFCSLGLDAFALELLNTTRLQGLVARFDKLYAAMRRVAYNVQAGLTSFVATLFTMLFATVYHLLFVQSDASAQKTGGDVQAPWRTTRGDIAAVIFVAILTLLGLHLLNQIAEVNAKCRRLPGLIQSLNFGAEIDHDKWCVADHIASLEAGFFVYNVPVTRWSVLKFGYSVLAATSFLLTRLVFAAQ
eukprot:TRINITY_DN883_c0_g2_i2.p1 TRINITY_DN883_c0_g2~~TRINITY_DN883_c0_g2_i2.p1  ORF type:complete len:1046 (+),score=133.49 TRINITY_DN883_c0_g2_i2:97-3234(+)